MALFENKYSDLENAGNKSFVLFLKENKYSDLNLLEFGGKVQNFPKNFRSRQFNLKAFPARFARIKL